MTNTLYLTKLKFKIKEEQIVSQWVGQNREMAQSAPNKKQITEYFTPMIRVKKAIH